MSQDKVTMEDLDGVGPATADKLTDGGYSSVEAVAAASPSELEERCDISENSAQKIIRSAQDKADIGGFNTGKEILDKRQDIGSITTGVEAFDELLGGGTETQSITEFFGQNSSGKTQVTHQLAVNVQLPKEFGGMDSQCIFIDTEDTFRPDRIRQMVDGLPDEAKQSLFEKHDIEGDLDNTENVEDLYHHVLDSIHVAKAENSNHQILLAEKARDIAGELAGDENQDDVGLIIVDSLTSHFRSEYVGRGSLAERQQKLNKHMHELIKLGSLYNAAAVVTNQVSANPDQFFGNPNDAIGGNIVGHNSTVRVFLRESKDDKRVAKLVDAPNLPDGEAVLRITNDGLVDE